MNRKFEIEIYKVGQWNAKYLCDKYKKYLGKKTNKRPDTTSSIGQIKTNYRIITNHKNTKLINPQSEIPLLIAVAVITSAF